MTPSARTKALLGLCFVASLCGAAPACAASHALWEGVAYVPSFFSLARYDLETGSWLDEVAVAALEVHADADGVYVGSWDGLYRIAPGGSQAELVLGGGQVTGIDSDSEWLFTILEGKLLVLPKAGGPPVAELDVPDMRSVTAARATRRLYLGGYGVAMLSYGEDGSLAELEAVDEAFLFAQGRGYLSPDGERFYDGSGHAFSATDLAYLGSFPSGGRMAFLGSTALVMSEGQLVGYEASFAEVGRIGVGTASDDVFTYEDRIFVLQGARVQSFTAADLGPQPRPVALDPEGLRYEPSLIELGSDGTVYLLDRGDKNLHRWSTTEERYLPSIGLPGFVSDMAFSAETETLFLLHLERQITRLTLLPEPGEETFTSAPIRLDSIAPAGDRIHGFNHLYHYAFASDGSFAAEPVLFEISDDAWSAARGRLYLVRYSDQRLLAFDLLADGSLGEPIEAPEGRGGAPVRISSDGSHLFSQDSMFDPASLVPLARSTEKPVLDAAWQGELLVTLEELGGETLLREWTPPYQVAVRELRVAGEPERILALGEGLLLIRRIGGVPSFAEIRAGRADLDGDGVLDGADLYPLDPGESADRDGDGVADNRDEFPDHREWSEDYDDDRIPDEVDWFPERSSPIAARLVLVQRFSLLPIGRLRGVAGFDLHMFEDGRFALCSRKDDCLQGGWAHRGRPGRFELLLDPSTIPQLEEALEEVASDALTVRFGQFVSAALDFPIDKVRLRARLEEGELHFSWRMKHRGLLPELRGRRVRGKFLSVGEGEVLAIP